MSRNEVTQRDKGPAVLVLDDEPEIRKLVSAVLAGDGYTVLTADNGEQAIKVYQKHEQPLDLLLLDVVLPGLSGPMVAERISQLQPGVRVMFMSGYDHSAVVQRYVIKPGFALLKKPFTPDQLTKQVREVLESPAPQPAQAE